MQNPHIGDIPIATRASPLALAQAHMVADLLRAAHPNLADAVKTVPMTTKGDKLLDRTLIEAGGKGLFTKELEVGLAAGAARLAVHSTKDVPTERPPGLMLSAFLPREDVRDCLITTDGKGFDALPEGAVVGTASLRRRALALSHRPDLEIVPIRGNVQTRLKKLANGDAAATFLAAAGLNRLDMSDTASEHLSLDRFLSAPGQGAVVVETRSDDHALRDVLAPLHDANTADAVTAERACLAALDGSCRTPIAAHAVLDGDKMTLRAMILSLDGQTVFEDSDSADRSDAGDLGYAVGSRIKKAAGKAFFDQLHRDMAVLLAHDTA